MTKRIDITDTVIAPNMQATGMKTLLTNKPKERVVKELYDGALLFGTKPIREQFFNETSLGPSLLKKIDDEISLSKDKLLLTTNLYDLGVLQGRVRGLQAARILILALKPPMSDTEVEQANKTKGASK